MFPGEPTLQGGRKPMTRIAVIGGGAWGTALADLLVRKGGLESVTLWAREPEVVEHVNRDHLNPVFLPGAALAPALRASGRSEEHTSELQSHSDLVCRLLLEKKKKKRECESVM